MVQYIYGRTPAPTARNSLPDTKRVRAYAKDKHNGAYWQKHLGDMAYDEEDKLDTTGAIRPQRR
jgi:hypothetical protein